jgi:hypothetical protein
MRRSAHMQFLIIAFVGVQSGTVLADVKLPAVIGSHMVLQRDHLVPVWGWAAPRESVSVHFAGTTSDTKADQSGRWQVILSKLAANSQPQWPGVKILSRSLDSTKSKLSSIFHGCISAEPTCLVASAMFTQLFLPER